MPCPYRHLVDCHPERVAFLYRNRLLSQEEGEAWGLQPCEEGEESPFATERDKLCFDFANHGVCKRNRKGFVCRFRHCRQEQNFWTATTAPMNGEAQWGQSQ